MLIYAISFIFFVLFVGMLAISLLFKKKPLVGEGEANAILEGMTCATCKRNCDLKGTDAVPSPSSCKGQGRIDCKEV
ncbi:MAG: hypothetical protein K6A65_03155 [Succinivibrionaceae bacterium]|nr:hypothetical protein [Succinivibrionaceae bacterium]